MTTTTLTCPESGVLPERFAIEITVDDIAQGEPGMANHCPIALAVMRWMQNQGVAFKAVTISSDDVLINLDWQTPSRPYWHDASSFVSDFDDGLPVEPRTVVFARLP